MANDRKDIKLPFSGVSYEDARRVLNWLKRIDKDHGLGVEAFDCILAAHKEGKKLTQGVWQAQREWDIV